MTALVWYRRDLRVRDHEALFKACQQHEQVIAWFSITKDQFKKNNISDAQCDLIYFSLNHLKEELSKLNIPLLITNDCDYKGSVEQLKKIIQKEKVSELYLNREDGIWEKERDDSCRKLIQSFNVFEDQCILKPGTVLNGSGKMFSVFTPFKRKWMECVNIIELKEFKKPKKKDIMYSLKTKSLTLPKYEDSQFKKWFKTESQVHRLLNSFIAENLDDYEKNRDFPSIRGTSQLSPYLAVGSISVKQCYLRVMENINSKVISKGAETWTSELIWREFYKHLMEAFPRLSKNRNFTQKTETLNWNESEEDFQKWCEGRTGVPLVDAAMRQLNTIGWMHNRLRMVTAMFLTKNLRVDWRKGEAYFMSKLIDGDFAANNGGWQWSASTGCDAVPYFRVFNPISQSKKFDPSGEFIKKYIPELAVLNEKSIHEPKSLELMTIDYPEPMVDIKISRAEAIAWFKEAVYERDV